MKKLFNFFFGWIVCLHFGHEKVVDKIIYLKDGNEIDYWHCSRCSADSYRDR